MATTLATLVFEMKYCSLCTLYCTQWRCRTSSCRVYLYFNYSLIQRMCSSKRPLLCFDCEGMKTLSPGGWLTSSFRIPRVCIRTLERVYSFDTKQTRETESNAWRLPALVIGDIAQPVTQSAHEHRNAPILFVIICGGICSDDVRVRCLHCICILCGHPHSPLCGTTQQSLGSVGASVIP